MPSRGALLLPEREEISADLALWLPGPIDAKDVRGGEIGFLWKHISVPREPMKMNVLPVFPAGFLDFGEIINFRSRSQKVIGHLGPANSQVIIPVKPPHNPSDVINPKDVFRQSVASRRVVNCVLFRDLHRLRQFRVKVERLGFVVCNNQIIWLRLLPQEFDTVTDGSNVRLREGSQKQKVFNWKKGGNSVCRNVECHDLALWIRILVSPANPRGDLTELSKCENKKQRKEKEIFSATQTDNQHSSCHR